MDGSPLAFDFKNPDYVAVVKRRAAFLLNIRADPGALPALRVYYKDHIADFINDWGMTYDPRNVERGLPAVIPFVLFPKQREWIDWVIAHWHGDDSFGGAPLLNRNGIVEKSRDFGMSWLSVSTACSLCIFYKGMAIGFGSRKEEYVDRIGSPKSLFFKARMFMNNLPIEFRAGWDRDRDAPHMRLNFPATKSNISGEAGDNIGRGDRTGIYFVDEAAYIERPELVEASLSQTTNCRIDISSANGMANSFAIKRHDGKHDVFTCHWRDDPRKDAAWYEKQVNDLDAVTVAQEIDINYTASVEGVLIPSAWVQAAIDSHIKLGFAPTGKIAASLDVADEGVDKNACCVAHGVVIKRLDEWSGKGDDIFRTVERAFGICDDEGCTELSYDADGLGAGVRGDSRVINEARDNSRGIRVTAWRGSGAIVKPEDEDVPGRKNQDMFLNAKAQEYWGLRVRFQKTYRAVVEGARFLPDDLISIPSDLPLRARLCTELSQPTYDRNAAGKTLINKAPNGSHSPNLADCVMIRFARASGGVSVWELIDD